MSIILEEFPGVLPSQLDGEPLIPLLRIVEARQYVRAVKAEEEWASSGGDKKNAPEGPLIDLVYWVQGERIKLDEEHGDNG